MTTTMYLLRPGSPTTAMAMATPTWTTTTATQTSTTVTTTKTNTHTTTLNRHEPPTQPPTNNCTQRGVTTVDTNFFWLL